MSQPTRAAWIEIFAVTVTFVLSAGRSPLGLRGLKSQFVNIGGNNRGVAALLGCVD